MTDQTCRNALFEAMQRGRIGEITLIRGLEPDADAIHLVGAPSEEIEKLAKEACDEIYKESLRSKHDNGDFGVAEMSFLCGDQHEVIVDTYNLKDLSDEISVVI